MKLQPENLIALVDSREQRPWNLAPLRMESATLATGDYTLKGLERIVSIERKSLDDLVNCVGRDRKRFERCVERMLAYPCRALIIESSWQVIELGRWPNRVKSSQVLGSLLSWQARGLNVCMGDTPDRAGRLCSRLLWAVANQRLREAEELQRVYREPKPRRTLAEALQTPHSLSAATN